MVLVRIRCRDCRRTLHEITVAPTDWSGTVSVRRCKRCWVPGAGTKRSWTLMSATAREGRDRFYLYAVIELESIREHIMEAQRHAETVDVMLNDPRWRFE